MPRGSDKLGRLEPQGMCSACNRAESLWMLTTFDLSSINGSFTPSELLIRFEYKLMHISAIGCYESEDS
jgi:hypothetical protein